LQACGPRFFITTKTQKNMITRDEVLLKAAKQELEVPMFEEGGKVLKLFVKSGIARFRVEVDGRTLYHGDDVNRAVDLFNNSGTESRLFYAMMHLDRKSAPGLREVFSDGYTLEGAFVRSKGFAPIGVTTYRVIFVTGESFDLTRNGSGPETSYQYRSPGIDGFKSVGVEEAFEMFQSRTKIERVPNYRLDSAIEETERQWEQ